MQKKIPCVVMRGGTSRALFFKEEDLPKDPAVWERTILAAFGSPDPNGRQINGLGGATSTTSKVAIISRREGEPNTVNYLFGQVSVTDALIDVKGNCGNISSAVGPFAIDEGLVDQIEEPYTTVRVYNTNTKKYIVGRVPVENGKAKVDGDFVIAGIAGSGAKIAMEFAHPGGAVTGKLLPTGNPTDELETEGFGTFTVSIVDAANPLVFVMAADLGITGLELPAQVDSNPELLRKLESIRSAATVKIGLASNCAEATKKSPAVAKMAFVSPPCDYPSVAGFTVKEPEIDLVARNMSMGKLHNAYAITGAICTASAAKVPGSLVWQVIPEERRASSEVCIGHPTGIVPITITMSEGPELVVEKGIAFRTARRLMEGSVFVPGEE